MGQIKKTNQSTNSLMYLEKLSLKESSWVSFRQIFENHDHKILTPEDFHASGSNASDLSQSARFQEHCLKTSTSLSLKEAKIKQINNLRDVPLK